MIAVKMFLSFFIVFVVATGIMFFLAVCVDKKQPFEKNMFITIGTVFGILTVLSMMGTLLSMVWTFL